MCGCALLQDEREVSWFVQESVFSAMRQKQGQLISRLCRGVIVSNTRAVGLLAVSVSYLVGLHAAGCWSASNTVVPVELNHTFSHEAKGSQNGSDPLTKCKCLKHARRPAHRVDQHTANTCWCADHHHHCMQGLIDTLCRPCWDTVRVLHVGFGAF